MVLKINETITFLRLFSTQQSPSCNLHPRNVLFSPLNSSSWDFTFHFPSLEWTQRCPPLLCLCLQPLLWWRALPPAQGEEEEKKVWTEEEKEKVSPPKWDDSAVEVYCWTPFFVSLEFRFICSCALGLLPTACRHWGKRKRRRRRAPRKASGIGRSSGLLWQYWQNGMTFIFRWPE